MKADLCFRFSTTEWRALARKLDCDDEGAWKEAIGVFERRITERFLSSIDALFAADTKPDLQSTNSTHTEHCIPGFSIMALCCLLIETLQGFREDPRGTNEDIKRFLRRPAFGNAFNGQVAGRFAKGIRNGIFHEAETRRWVIWRDEPTGKIVASEGDGFALNRSLFYAAVRREFESYRKELRDAANPDLRKRFKKKMDVLCGKA